LRESSTEGDLVKIFSKIGTAIALGLLMGFVAVSASSVPASESKSYLSALNESIAAEASIETGTAMAVHFIAAVPFASLASPHDLNSPTRVTTTSAQSNPF
jgi:hypothetical protein